MRTANQLTIEGLSVDEILSLPAAQFEALIFTGQPIVFKAGTATVLGEFRRTESILTIELAQIEGGGEGVLLALSSLARRYAKMQGIAEVEWIVHAVTCAKPNLKLRRMLERRGFVLREIPNIGPVYSLVERVIESAPEA